MTCTSFIDYEKAFDSVKHGILFDYLKEAGVDKDDKDIRLIAGSSDKDKWEYWLIQ